MTQSRSKHFLFYGIALAIPFMFFLLLELALRIGGFGQTVPLFIENPANPNYLLPRPDIMARYFKDPDKRPAVTLEANFLLKEKPANGIRIIVQGGSTAAGFPYGLGASIAGTLDQRLKQSLPGKYVEVVNTALSAVNSYTVLDLADEIIAQQPDAVLIYAGHNEYLGILGVGSSFQTADTAGLTMLFLRLKDLRLFQLMQHLFDIFQPSAPSADEGKQSGRTFMAQAAANRGIPYNSEIFHRGIRQFERNLSLVLKKYRDANVPVFISTVASNESGQPPFESGSQSDELFAQLKMLNDLPPTRRIVELNKISAAVEGIDNADFHFQVAQQYASLRQFENAKKHFTLAKDFDQLRFRAPSEINKLIDKLSENDGIFKVEAEKYFRDRSPNRIIGNNLMLEHLHPNLQGYYVLSEAFYQAMMNSNIFGPWNNVEIRQAWSEKLIMPAEEFMGFATIQNLKSDYPFSPTPVPLRLPEPADWQQSLGLELFEKRSSWLDVMERSLVRYRQDNDQRNAFKVLRMLADAMPHNGLYNIQTAEIFERNRRYNEAAHYYFRAQASGALGQDNAEKAKLLWEKALEKYK